MWLVFPHRGSRDGINPAVLHVRHTAVNLNPHFPQNSTSELWRTAVRQTMSPPTGHQETDTLPSSSASVISSFSFFHHFSTLTLFYAELAALPMCIIPHFLLTGRENDEENRLMTTVAGTMRKLERLPLKMLFSLSFGYISFSNPILCCDRTVDFSHREM